MVRQQDKVLDVSWVARKCSMAHLLSSSACLLEAAPQLAGGWLT